MTTSKDFFMEEREAETIQDNFLSPLPIINTNTIAPADEMIEVMQGDKPSIVDNDTGEVIASIVDITKLIGVSCMLNVIHKPSKSDPF